MTPGLAACRPAQPSCADALFVRLLHGWRPYGGLRRIEAAGTPAALRFWWHRWWWTPGLAAPGSCRYPAPDALHAIVDELRPAFDDLEILCWFIEPSPRLGGQPPLALLGRQPLRVLECARRDRFVGAR